MQLFRIVCRGMQTGHGTAYVVAENTDDAYRALREHLDRLKLGFTRDRELDRIELIGDTNSFGGDRDVPLLIVLDED